MKYSNEFKATMVRKLATPGGPSATRLAKEVGIHQATLSRWLREAGRVNADRVVPFATHARSPMSAKRPQDWTAEEKLAAVVEASGLSDEELGAFLRRKGLHQAQLEEWRQQVLSGLGKRPARPAKSATQGRRIKALETELRRKEKALAEAAALLVLQKKVRELWGDGDDDTPRKSAR